MSSNQHIPGPRLHLDQESVTLSYINKLEEELYNLRHYPMILSATAPAPESDQMSAVRAKNTELEKINRDLSEAIHGLNDDILLMRQEKDGKMLVFREMEAQINRLKVAASNKALTEAGMMHPWDTPMEPSKDNPLGDTATNLIVWGRTRIDELEQQQRALCNVVSAQAHVISTHEEAQRQMKERMAAHIKATEAPERGD